MLLSINSFWLQDFLFNYQVSLRSITPPGQPRYYFLSSFPPNVLLHSDKTKTTGRKFCWWRRRQHNMPRINARILFNSINSSVLISSDMHVASFKIWLKSSPNVHCYICRPKLALYLRLKDLPKIVNAL